MSALQSSSPPVILSLLDDVSRRLRWQSALDQLVFTASLLLFTFLAWNLLRPVAGGAANAAAVAAAMLVVGVMAWRLSQPASLVRAAAEADRYGQLNDELKSACWFLQSAETGPWIEAHIERAAVTAETLDARRIVPSRWPRQWVVFLVLCVAAVLFPRVPQVSGLSFESPLPGQGMPSTGPNLSLRQGNAQEKALDAALKTLQDSTASNEDKARALERGREAIDRANLEAVSARDALLELAAAMQGNRDTQSAAEAMKEGRPQEALDQLKKLAQEMERLTARKSDEMEVTAQDAKAGLSSRDPEQTAQDATRDVKRVAARVNQETLDKVIKSLEQITDQVESQARVNAAKRTMESNLVATSQRSALWANQFGQSAKTPPNMNAQPSPDTGNANIKGGAMFRMGAVAKGDKEDQASEGSKAGSSSGHSEALAVEGAATQRLGVKLKREAIQSHALDEKEKGGAKNDWFYAASREEKSKVGFTDSDARSGFVRENSAASDSVPMKYRGLVKEYFTAVHEEKPQPQ
jgi:hypothetical protein